MNRSEQIWHDAILPTQANIGQAIRNLDQTAIKIVLVTNEAGVLEGTISDGDIRRGLLRGLNLESPLSSIIHRNAVVVPPEMERALVRQLMLANKIQQIPIVDQYHHVVGMGTRLRPHTENCPKPMLLVAGKPMLEHIIERAKSEGFYQFILAIHYLGHMVEAHFGDGGRLDVQIEYLREVSPLGTAGALSLLKSPLSTPFIVTNGDVMTDIRYGELLDFHTRHDAAGTMAVRPFELQHPFGVVRTQGVEIVGFEEKPIYRTQINAGVYVLEPGTLSVLETNTHCDMPMLFERLQAKSQRTIAYPMYEPWLDVGNPADWKQANIERKLSTRG
jgi:dTDP-glucose pyrophosphorylase